VQGKIKWGAPMSHEMISTLTYTLIEVASFILDNSEMMPMMHDDARFDFP
jgi:hypothetical protein